MQQSRSGHAATLLSDGHVLVVGGATYTSQFVILASAELYDPATDAWTFAGALNQARDGPTATLLLDGRVLVAGGSDSSGTFNTVEVYDPLTRAWSMTGSLHTSRDGYSATLLPNGKVLVAGGAFAFTNDLSSAELYDPASGTWTLTGSMATARSGHTATLLPNGKVLVAGGYYTNSLSTAELYDPATGTWTVTGSMASKRSLHTATLLPNGQVLVAAGGEYVDSTIIYLSSAELYDPATGAWTPATPLITARASHEATMLLDGRVLVTGGFSADELNFLPVSAELYDASTSVGGSRQPPILTSAKILANGSFQIAFTNTPAALFSVLATTNPAVPFANWTVLGSVTELWAGHFQFTDVQATTYPQRFYRLRSL
jgi:N-acetylneuraminic acid mutarotase